MRRPTAQLLAATVVLPHRATDSSLHQVSTVLLRRANTPLKDHPKASMVLHLQVSTVLHLQVSMVLHLQVSMVPLPQASTVPLLQVSSHHKDHHMANSVRHRVASLVIRVSSSTVGPLRAAGTRDILE